MNEREEFAELERERQRKGDERRMIRDLKMRKREELREIEWERQKKGERKKDGERE